MENLSFEEFVKSLKPEELPPLLPFQLALLKAAQSGKRFIWTGRNYGRKYLSDMLKKRYEETRNSKAQTKTGNR